MSYQSDALDNDTVAYASFLAGLMAMFAPLLVVCCAPIASIVAIACGSFYIARHDKTIDNQKDMLLSYLGVAMGIIGLLVFLMMSIV